jgi:hypothetical protein
LHEVLNVLNGIQFHNILNVLNKPLHNAFQFHNVLHVLNWIHTQNEFHVLDRCSCRMYSMC